MPFVTNGEHWVIAVILMAGVLWCSPPVIRHPLT
jgi:hypothetical protein